MRVPPGVRQKDFADALVQFERVAGGFWLLIGEVERFVPFTEFAWFKDARISELIKVELPSPHHLYWA